MKLIPRSFTNKPKKDIAADPLLPLTKCSAVLAGTGNGIQKLADLELALTL